MYDEADEAATSVKAYRAGLSRGARALVGPSFSSIAAYLAMLSGIDQVPMCSFWASSPSLSSKENFPYFGRTYPSDTTATRALPQMISALGWKSIAVIHTDDDYANQYTEGLRDNAPRFGVDVIGAWKFEPGDRGSISGAVKKIRDSGTNIFVAISSTNSDLSTIFYEAEQQGIVGKDYAWLTTDSVSAEGTIDHATDPALARRLLDGTVNVLRHGSNRTLALTPVVRSGAGAEVGLGLGPRAPLHSVGHRVAQFYASAAGSDGYKRLSRA